MRKSRNSKFRTLAMWLVLAGIGAAHYFYLNRGLLNPSFSISWGDTHPDDLKDLKLFRYSESAIRNDSSGNPVREKCILFDGEKFSTCVSNPMGGRIRVRYGKYFYYYYLPDIVPESGKKIEWQLSMHKFGETPHLACWKKENGNIVYTFNYVPFIYLPE